MSTRNTHLLETLPSEEVFHKIFADLSAQAAEAHPALNLKVPNEILREDIIPCLEAALNQPIDMAPMYILNCFAIDVSGIISWEEFKLSLQRMRLLKPPQTISPVSRTTTRSHAKLMEVRRKGRAVVPQPQDIHTIPLTTAQEVGWLHGAAPTMPKHDNIEKYSGIKGTDVTRGGEGRTIMSYYGPHLGRSF